MKQTNYQLFDFLDFDPELLGEETLWKALKEPRKNYFLRFRAYGEKILRVATGL